MAVVVTVHSTFPQVERRMSASFTHESDPCAYTQTLVACMEQRLELLEALKALSDVQASVADEADVNTTLGILARKQALLDELNEVQQRLEPYLHDDPEQRVWPSQERRAYCQRIADQGQRWLQATLQIEQITLDKVSSRRDAVAAQLRDGQDSILAQNAYQSDQLFGSSTLDIGGI